MKTLINKIISVVYYVYMSAKHGRFDINDYRPPNLCEIYTYIKDNEHSVWASMLIFFNILDFFGTRCLINVIGMEAEANPFLVYLTEATGTFWSVLLFKATFLSIIWVLRKRIKPWIFCILTLIYAFVSFLAVGKCFMLPSLMM